MIPRVIHRMALSRPGGGRILCPMASLRRRPAARLGALLPTCGLLVPLVLGACGAGARPDSAAAEPELSMLDVMIQIDHAFTALEPNFRNPEALEENALAAQQILDWTEIPLFADYVEGERFVDRDPAGWFALHEQLQSGASRLLDAARSGDLDSMRAGFIEMKTSCIACHKGYSPSY